MVCKPTKASAVHRARWNVQADVVVIGGGVMGASIGREPGRTRRRDHRPRRTRRPGMRVDVESGRRSTPPVLRRGQHRPCPCAAWRSSAPSRRTTASTSTSCPTATSSSSTLLSRSRRSRPTSPSSAAWASTPGCSPSPRSPSSLPSSTPRVSSLGHSTAAMGTARRRPSSPATSRPPGRAESRCASRARSRDSPRGVPRGSGRSPRWRPRWVPSPVRRSCARPGHGRASSGEMAGVDLPVTPPRREIMVSEPVDFDTSTMPFTIDFATSYYVHPEGPGLLFGPRRGGPVGLRRTPRPRVAVPTLRTHRARTPDLADVEVKRGWAGLYEMTPRPQRTHRPGARARRIHLRVRVLRTRVPHGSRGR